MRDVVKLEMCKTLTTVCTEYRLAAHAYMSFAQGAGGCGHSGSA